MIYYNKKILKYFISLCIGLILIVNGLLNFYFNSSKSYISDDEIISKAKELGMLEITEAYRMWKNNEIIDTMD